MPSSSENKSSVVHGRDIYDLVQGFIGLLSPEGNLLDANRSALNFIGVDLNEIVGTPFWETPWWRDFPKCRDALKDAIRRSASGEASRFEAQVTGKTGQVVVIDFLLTPIINEAGVVVSLVPEARDITKIKQAQNALQESDARLRLACDAGEMGTWDWNLTNGTLHWSDRQYELFGFSKPDGDMHVDQVMASVHPDDLERVKADIELAIKNNILFRTEFRVIHESGEIRWLVGQGNTLHEGEDGKTMSMMGVNYDITERKNLELELAQVNLELEARVVDRTHALEEEMRERQKAEAALAHSQRFELIGQLAGGIAHDFNNLLAVISGNLELATMRIEDERIIGMINDALEAVEAGASINRRLLSFARARSLEAVPLAVNDRILKTRQLLERPLGENIVFEPKLSSDLWEATVDPGELDSAILNLVLNARDAMPSGGKLSIETCNLTFNEDDIKSMPEAHELEYIQVSVSDTGIGMTPDVQEKAMTPYFTTKGSGKGSGLGLSSVFGFAAQSDGFVRIESEDGKGTTVNIYLPRSSSPSNARKGETPKNDMPLGQGELILLVEDDHKVRRVTHQRLVELGYSVIEANTAAEATELLESNEPVSVIFSDVRMPGEMSGYDLARWVRENRSGIGILLTSGYHDLTAEEQQDVQLLAKPYSIAHMASALRDIITSHDSRLAKPSSVL